MSPTELMEQRADRGTARGATEVWAGAQHTLRSEQSSDTRASKTGLRVALVLSAAALALFAGLLAEPFGTEDSALLPVASEEATEADAEPSEPAPILIDGMTLTNVDEPWSESERETTTFTTDESPTIESTRVYADTSDPFAGPIVGIDTLIGGGFSPWSANLSVAELNSLTATVVREGQSWRLPDDNELNEVGEFSDDPENPVLNGWQLDFRDGNDGAVLQAEQGATEWVWLSRLLRNRSPEEALSVSPIKVLGEDGAIVDDEVLWESDGFVYRLTANELLGDTSYSRPADAVIDQLQIVDRVEWESAVGRAQSRFSTRTTEIELTLLLLAVWTLTVLALGVWNRRRIVPMALLAVLGVAAWVVLAPSLWFIVALVLLSLVALGLLRTTRPAP